MGTVVEVRNTNGPGGAGVRVVSQKVVEDGRELYPNGTDDVAPGETQSFIIHGKQTLSIIELVPEVAPAEPEAVAAVVETAAAAATEVAK